MKTIKAIGHIKDCISEALYNDKNICSFLFRGKSEMSREEKLTEFRKCVSNHLFVDDTLDDTFPRIFFDVIVRSTSPTVKECVVYIYALVYKGELDYMPKFDGYDTRGNYADVLAEMVEDCIINDPSVANSLGIGKATLSQVDIYNSHQWYGHILTITVPDFK